MFFFVIWKVCRRLGRKVRWSFLSLVVSSRWGRRTGWNLWYKPKKKIRGNPFFQLRVRVCIRYLKKNHSRFSIKMNSKRNVCRWRMKIITDLYNVLFQIRTFVILNSRELWTWTWCQNWRALCLIHSSHSHGRELA